MLCGEPLQHVCPERRRRGDGDPRQCALPRQDEPGAQLGHCLAARLRIRAIDDHLAVEVVELVLDDAGGHALELEVNGGSRGVEPIERDFESALHGHPNGAGNNLRAIYQAHPFLIHPDQIVSGIADMRASR